MFRCRLFSCDVVKFIACLFISGLLFTAFSAFFSQKAQAEPTIFWQSGYYETSGGCEDHCASPDAVFQDWVDLSGVYVDWRIDEDHEDGAYVYDDENRLIRVNGEMQHFLSGGWLVATANAYCEDNGVTVAFKECFDPPDCFNSSEAESVGNPCDIRSGRKTQIETDFSTFGAHSLSFIRYYTSDSIYRSSLGLGWRSNFDSSLEFIDATTIHAVRPHAQTYIFTKVGNDWTAAANVRSSLVEEIDGTYTYTRADNVVERYDSSGRLTEIKWLDGYTQTLTYNGVNKYPEQVDDSYNRSISLVYDTNDFLTSVTAPDGSIYKYERPTGAQDFQDTIGKVIYPDETAADDSDNPFKQYLYEDANTSNLLTGIVDEKGVQYATYTYNTDGLATTTEHAGTVEKYTISYDEVNNTRDVTGPLGEDLTYTYTSVIGELRLSQIDRAAITGQVAATENRTYDANGFLASTTAFDGTLTTYVFNSDGQLTSRTDADGDPEEVTTTFSWHGTFNLPTQIVMPNRTIDFTYDSNGKLLTRKITDTTSQSVPYTTNGETRIWTFTYNVDGTIATINGPRTDVTDTTTFAYDGNKNISSITNALGHVIQITSYDGAGRPLSITDENGVVRTFTYTPRGWLETQTVQHTSGNATTRFKYDDTGNLTEVISPMGVTTLYEYDNAQRLIAIENAAGDRIEYTLDVMGNATATTVKDSTGALFSSQTALYNEFGWLIKAFGAQNQETIFAYDSIGLNTSITDPLSNTTSNSFDALGRIIATTDALSGVAEATYDDNANPLTFEDQRNLQTSHVYNGFGEVIQRTSPDTGTEVYEYDSAGNLIKKTDNRNIVAEFVYDAINRVISVTYPGNTAENVTYTYDDTTGGNYGKGRLTSVLDESGTTSYTYDHTGNLIAEAKTIGTTSYDTAYRYNLDNILIGITYPSGRIVSYLRDAAGRVNSITTQSDGTTNPVAVVDAITYKPFGRMHQVTLSNGLMLSYTYDTDGQLTSIVTGDGATNVQDLSFVYDDAGNITAITDAVTAANNQTLTYDGLWRLTKAIGPYGTIDYAYDAVGNRTSRVVNTGTIDTETYTYSTTSNQLNSMTANAGTRNFTYNTAGHMASDDRYGTANLTFLYNHAGRYQEKQLSGVADIRYKYNAFGERVVKEDVSTGTKTHFHYSPDGAMLGLSDGGTGNPLEDYIFVGGVLIAKALPQSSTPTSTESIKTDNEDPGTGVGGSWATDTTAPDIIGNNHYTHDGDLASLAGTIIVDNASSDFRVTGEWSILSGSNEYGVNYHRRDPTQSTFVSIIIDNDDAEATVTGAWGFGTDTNYYGVDYLRLEATNLPTTAVIIDNIDAGFSVTGTTITETQKDRYGDDQVSVASGISPTGGIIVDNGDPGFSTTGSWTTETSGSGYYGSDVLYTAAMGTSTGEMIIDNNDPDFMLIGSWSTKTTSTAYNGNYKYRVDSTSSFNRRAFWHFNVSQDGDYEVWAWWGYRSGASTEMAYIVNHADGKTPVFVSQRQNYGQWVFLGTFPFRADKDAVVEIDNYSPTNYYVVADAVRLRPVSATYPTATWTPGLSTAGEYAVYTKARIQVNSTGTAQYTVTHDGGTTDVAISQKNLPSDNWGLLGIFNMTPGQGHGVTLTATGEVDADAMMFVNVDSATAAGTATWSLDPATAGDYDIYVRWAAPAERAGMTAYTVTHAGGSSEVTVNQNVQSGRWIKLGTYTLTPSAGHKVALLGKGPSSADAVAMVPAGDEFPNVTYDPAVPVIDTYQVEAWWPQDRLRPKNTDVQMKTVQGTILVPTDQDTQGDQWIDLGTFEMAPASNHGAVITSNVGETGHPWASPAADAFRFTTTGDKRAIWTPDIPSAQRYVVYARWPGVTGSASNAKFTIFHDAGASDVIVNQTIQGGAWVRLGVYDFSPESDQRIELSDAGANGNLMADAVMLVPETAMAAEAVTWNATVEAGEEYDIYVHYAAAPDRAQAARYYVAAGGGLTESVVDQSSGAGGWVKLGAYSFSGTAAAVSLYPTAAGTLSADGLWLVKSGVGADDIVHVLTDHLGTPVKLVDSTKVVVWSRVQTPFGLTYNESTSGAWATSVRFPGQMRDAETDLNYNYFRDYDPSTGRYIESDPVGLLAGFNTYGYVGQDPIRGIDPFGLDCLRLGNMAACTFNDGTAVGPFPVDAGWPTYINSNSDTGPGHEYIIPVLFGNLDPNCILDALTNHFPTPSKDARRATSEGTPNNEAIPDLWDFFLDLAGQNKGPRQPVTSYETQDSNGNVGVLNITEPGHVLYPGIVWRPVVGNSVVHYGQGSGAIQGDLQKFFGPNFLNKKIWTDATLKILKKCAHTGCKGGGGF